MTNIEFIMEYVPFLESLIDELDFEPDWLDHEHTPEISSNNIVAKYYVSIIEKVVTDLKRQKELANISDELIDLVKSLSDKVKGEGANTVIDYMTDQNEDELFIDCARELHDLRLLEPTFNWLVYMLIGYDVADVGYDVADDE